MEILKDDELETVVSVPKAETDQLMTDLSQVQPEAIREPQAFETSVGTTKGVNNAGPIETAKISDSAIAGKGRKIDFAPMDMGGYVAPEPQVKAPSIGEFSADPNAIAQAKTKGIQQGTEAEIAGEQAKMLGEQESLGMTAQGIDNRVKGLEAEKQFFENRRNQVLDQLADNSKADEEIRKDDDLEKLFSPQQKNNLIGDILFVIGAGVAGYAGLQDFYFNQWNKVQDRKAQQLKTEAANRLAYLKSKNKGNKEASQSERRMLEWFAKSDETQVKKLMERIADSKLELEKEKAKDPKIKAAAEQVQAKLRAQMAVKESEIKAQKLKDIQEKKRFELANVEKVQTPLNAKGYRVSQPTQAVIGGNLALTYPDYSNSKKSFILNGVAPKDVEIFRDQTASARDLYGNIYKRILALDAKANIWDRQDWYTTETGGKLRSLLSEAQISLLKAKNLGVPTGRDLEMVNALIGNNGAIKQSLGSLKAVIPTQQQRVKEFMKEKERVYNIPLGNAFKGIE